MEQFYDSEIEIAMKRVYDSFSEKDKRMDAAIEVKKLSYGGLSYISNILDCDPKTIYQGLKELETKGEAPNQRKRHPGGRLWKTAIQEPVWFLQFFAQKEYPVLTALQESEKE